jgi:outer membrane protein assembly factor BamB
MKDLRRHVLCLNRTNGKILWDRQFEPRLRESKYAGGNSSRHGYSSSTPTTDGERLYVFFGKSGVYCLDLDGKELWNTTVGSDTHGWGSSNSPVLFENLVIVNASVESKSLVALNKITGEEVWRTENIRRSWNTPLLVDVPNGKTELVVSETETVLGFDPRSGEELWRVTGFGGYVCPSVVAHDGVVYIVRGNSLAIRAGGRGDVTDTHVLWRGRGRSVVPSPIYHNGHIYWIARGTAVCLNAKSGELVFQERLGPDTGVVYSSIIAADDKLYCASQHNGTYVLAAKPEFQLLSHNVFDDDNGRTNSSPIVSRGQLLMRTDRFLYCIGAK